MHISSSMSLKVPLEYSLQSARLGREGEFTGWGGGGGGDKEEVSKMF